MQVPKKIFVILKTKTKAIDSMKLKWVIFAEDLVKNGYNSKSASSAVGYLQ